MAFGGGVQAIKRFGGGARRSGEAKSEIGAHEVVVDGFWNPNDGKTGLGDGG